MFVKKGKKNEKKKNRRERKKDEKIFVLWLRLRSFVNTFVVLMYFCTARMCSMQNVSNTECFYHSLLLRVLILHPLFLHRPARWISYICICIYVYMHIYTHTHARAREGKKIKRKRERIEVCLSTMKRHDLSSIISFRCLHSLVEGTKPLRRGPFLSSPPLDPFFYQNTPLRNLLFFFDSTGQFFFFYFYFDLYLYSSFYQRLFIVGR